MFGFSLQKLLVLAAIVGAVWYGFKLVSRFQEANKLDQGAGGGGKRQGLWRRASKVKGASSDGAEDMVRCPVCDTYVARGTSSCGRADCPY